MIGRDDLGDRTRKALEQIADNGQLTSRELVFAAGQIVRAVEQRMAGSPRHTDIMRTVKDMESLEESLR